MYDYLAKIILLGPSGSGKYDTISSIERKAKLIAVQVLFAP